MQKGNPGASRAIPHAGGAFLRLFDRPGGEVPDDSGEKYSHSERLYPRFSRKRMVNAERHRDAYHGNRGGDN